MAGSASSSCTQHEKADVASAAVSSSGDNRQTGMERRSALKQMFCRQSLSSSEDGLHVCTSSSSENDIKQSALLVGANCPAGPHLLYLVSKGCQLAAKSACMSCDQVVFDGVRRSGERQLQGLDLATALSVTKVLNFYLVAALD
ncbi:MAG: hypothetical protein FRX49_10278 [Trebouxia sp. A1-2]|nr:MAG: hypothetical protein FRX49_10278 [Trebouxia sp. A1-2]